MPVRSSDRTRVNLLASSASLAAYASRPDLGGAVGAAAGDDEAAGQHLSPACLAIGSASPVSSDSSTSRSAALDHLAVDDDLVAGPQFDDVVEYHLVRGQLGPGPPSRRTVGLACADDGQLVQGLLGP